MLDCMEQDYKTIEGLIKSEKGIVNAKFNEPIMFYFALGAYQDEKYLNKVPENLAIQAALAAINYFN